MPMVMMLMIPAAATAGRLWEDSDMIEIGISTIDDGIKQACMILDQRLANVRYRVCHQVTDSKDHSHVYERYPMWNSW